MSKSKNLSATQIEELLNILKTRIEKNTNRHQGMEWQNVATKLTANPEKLWSLNEMEQSGGEPDVVEYDAKTKEFVFYDCIAEAARCYDVNKSTLSGFLTGFRKNKTCCLGT